MRLAILWALLSVTAFAQVQSPGHTGALAAGTVLYSLTVNTAGSGSGTINNVANCATGTTTLAAGTTVTCSETPNSGSTFTGWSGNCSGTGSCSFSISGTSTVTATFASGTTVTAASCSASDVQAACNLLTNTTTVLQIPACTGGVSWTTNVTCDVPSGNTNLSVLGAGSLTIPGGNNQTVIKDDVANNNPIFEVTTGSSSTTYRMAGITFEGDSSLPDNNAKYNGMLSINGLSSNFRLDHVTLDQTTYNPATSNGNATLANMGDCIWGSVDHGIYKTHGTGNAVRELTGKCFGDSGGQGDQAWSHGPDFGTNEYLYLENNTFVADFWNGFINDLWLGGRMVVRFNNSTSGSLQVHATGSGNGSGRSGRAMEIYNNTFTGIFDSGSGNPSYNVDFITGGTALIFNNNAAPSGSAGWKNFLDLVNDHFNGATNYDLCGSSSQGFMYNGTTAINNLFLPDVRRSDYASVPSPWDGNTNTEGYPVLDQPGRGAGWLLSGSYPGGCVSGGTRCSYSNTAGTGSCVVQYPNQASEPIYLWGNTWSCPSGNCGVNVGLTDATSNLIGENRDFYRDTDNSGNLRTFTGNPSTGPGTGSGTLAARPSTCTQGVAYWATDQGSWNSSGSGGQGVLYVCGASGWPSTPTYTPYQYPHPLDH